MNNEVDVGLFRDGTVRVMTTREETYDAEESVAVSVDVEDGEIVIYVRKMKGRVLEDPRRVSLGPAFPPDRNEV